LDAINIFEAWEMQSCDFLLQHFVIVCLHALLLDCTVDIFVPFTRRKWVVGFVVSILLKATIKVAFPKLDMRIDWWNTGARVDFCPRQRR
jgi:hypothetical protein